jgi:hypothetical protein
VSMARRCYVHNGLISLLNCYYTTD